LAGCCGYKNQILYPHTSNTYTIDPRLYGHHLTTLQRLDEVSAHPRQFMNLQSDTVSSAMDEIRPVSSLRNDAATYFVN
jgi:hypothetical protein